MKTTKIITVALDGKGTCIHQNENGTRKEEEAIIKGYREITGKFAIEAGMDQKEVLAGFDACVIVAKADNYYGLLVEVSLRKTNPEIAFAAITKEKYAELVQDYKIEGNRSLRSCLTDPTKHLYGFTFAPKEKNDAPRTRH